MSRNFPRVVDSGSRALFSVLTPGCKRARLLSIVRGERLYRVS